MSADQIRVGRNYVWLEPKISREDVFDGLPGLLGQAKESASSRALTLPFSLDFFPSLIHRPLKKI